MLDKHVEQLQKQLNEIAALRKEDTSSPAFVRWREAAKRRIEAIFGRESEHFEKFSSIRYISYVAVADQRRQQEIDRRAFLGGLQSARNRLLVMIDELTESAALEELRIDQRSSPALRHQAPTEPSRVLERFRECCHYLREAPERESDVQDILWLLLRSHYDDLEREETLPTFGIKNYRPDFGIPSLRLLIEVKFIGARTDVSRIQEGVLADVPGYVNSATGYDSLIVFVYDAAHQLRDHRKFLEDLESVVGIVGVIVIPGLR